MNYDVTPLTDVMDTLLGENGCPWDKVQTHQSIRGDFLEEVYEVLEAIDCDSKEMLREELGDVLLQVLLNAEIAKEKGLFTFEDVVQTLSEKLIRRHPHVFGDIKPPETPEEALALWRSVKQIEKDRKIKKEEEKL